MSSIGKKAPAMRMTMVCVTITALFAATVFTVTTATAQTSQTTGQRTTLHVGIVVEHQVIVAGPYARYAQKYLGVAAPLADKVFHKIISVKILDHSDITHSMESLPEVSSSHMNPESGFPRLTVDKTSAVALSLEENARLAAERIFEIRKSRFDLITGEVGENVFGGGLGDALKELGRLEEEYLSLFLGKQITRKGFKQYRIIPAKGKSTYTVCRFSDTDGLLPENDLSGIPVVLELTPTVDTPAEGLTVPVKPNARAIPQLIPADIRCRIIYEGTELASELFPIWQLGETVYLAQ